MNTVNTTQRQPFVRGLLSLAGNLDDPTPPEREFLDQLLVIAANMEPEAATVEDDIQPFRDLIMGNWDNLRWRLLGTTAEAVQALTDTQKAVLRVLEDSPNLLGPLEQSRTETVHTRLIAWFLGRADAVGRRCRSSLFGHLGVGQSEEATVQTELLVAEGCRVDLVVETPSTLAYIEAKVDAGERPAQLDDYDAVLQSTAQQRGLQPLLAFLTLAEQAPSTSSAPYVHLTFKDLMGLWLPATLLRGPTAEYLAAYLSTVSRDLCDVSETGPFVGWSLQSKHRTLKILTSLEVTDGQ